MSDSICTVARTRAAASAGLQYYVERCCSGFPSVQYYNSSGDWVSAFPGLQTAIESPVIPASGGDPGISLYEWIAETALGTLTDNCVMKVVFVDSTGHVVVDSEEFSLNVARSWDESVSGSGELVRETDGTYAEDSFGGRLDRISGPNYSVVSAPGILDGDPSTTGSTSYLEGAWGSFITTFFDTNYSCGNTIGQSVNGVTGNPQVTALGAILSTWEAMACNSIDVGDTGSPNSSLVEGVQYLIDSSAITGIQLTDVLGNGKTVDEALSCACNGPDLSGIQDILLALQNSVAGMQQALNGMDSVSWSTFFEDQDMDDVEPVGGSPAERLISGIYGSDPCTNPAVQLWMDKVADSVLKRDGCLAEQSCAGGTHTGKNLLGAASLMTNHYESVPASNGKRQVTVRSFCNPSDPVGHPIVRTTCEDTADEPCCEAPKYKTTPEPGSSGGCCG